jgi:hypothetical protein
MIQSKSYILIFVLLGVLTTAWAKKPANSYTDKPVLLYVSAENQPDTMGFNIATQLPELIYALLLQEKITLWDSPKKSIKISAEALQSIEKNTKSEFTKTKSIFMNELWTSSKRKTSFFIVGISFMNESVKGKVSYGYVDLAEASPFLEKEYVKTNQNGSAFVNFMQALYSRRYLYTLVQFGEENFRENINLAEKIKEDAFGNHKKQVSIFKLQDVKNVVYSIRHNPAEKDGGGVLMFDGFEKILSENRELFFELGAHQFFNFKTYKSELAVTRIEVEEIWRKKGDDIITTPISITLYVNNKKLNSISISELRKMQTNLSLKFVEDILLEKPYEIDFVRINRAFIKPEESDKYLNAIKEHSWTQISRYVKYSE